MRLSVATLVLAGALSVSASSHDAFGKRAHRNRQLASVNTTATAYIPHRIRYPGDHDPDDVEDGLEYDEDDERDASWFTSSYDETDEEVPEWDAEEYAHNNGSTPIVDAKTAVHDLGKRGVGWKKQGLAWTDEVKGAMHLFKGKGLWALYTWTDWCPQEAKDNKIPCVPMLGRGAKRDAFKNKVKTNCYGGSCWIMSLNEVNHAAQANASPGYAAWIHRTYITPLKKKFPNYKVMGPSTANGPSALTWYREFRKQSDVWKTLDAVNVHYYGTDYNKVIAWIEQWYNEFGKPVALTENACHSFGGKTKCSQQQAIVFQQKIAKYCNSTKKCLTHMIFGTFAYTSRNHIVTTNRLFNSKNELSPLGKVWVNL